jgi:hypothetical protein
MSDANISYTIIYGIEKPVPKRRKVSIFKIISWKSGAVLSY